MILLPQVAWEIKKTQTKGKGIFAQKEITAGTVVGDYIGRVIKTAIEDTTEKNGMYLMYYHDYASLYPEDIASAGIHLMNHACRPNCWLYTYKGHTLFFTLRQIFPGEELTASYLLSPEEGCSPCTHQCRCGIKMCTGTMHLTKKRFQEWDAFHEEQSKKIKRARVRYGKVLPKLKTYPKSIPDHPIYDLFGNCNKPSYKNTGKTMPSIKELRKLIRDTGRTIAFPQLQTTILGIQDGKITSD